MFMKPYEHQKCCVAYMETKAEPVLLVGAYGWLWASEVLKAAALKLRPELELLSVAPLNAL